ncbi:MAG: hypothetical protein HYS12_26935 [Planctomycetes bacterium]|nr:hypothetical protein [Planctomycetota bacterium]
MTGAAGQQRVPIDFIANYPVALPPLDEQRAILAHIEQVKVTFDESIKRAETEIELIREYRTRLISDVVTGKVDVRSLAPEAAEVATDDLEPLDEAEEFFEDELQDAADLEPVEEVADADD